MRNLPLFFAVLLLFSSCTSYQYHTLNSSIPENGLNRFEFENDSAIIRYHFQGEGGMLSLHYFNKLDWPVVIKWDQSALIFDGKSESMWQDHATVDLEGELFVSGQITKPTSETFVPPKSEISRQVMQIHQKNITSNLPSGAKEPVGKSYAKVHRFDKESSPLLFRSYITVGKADGGPTSTIDHQFWLKTTHESLNAPSYHFSNENPFYTSESTGAGEFLGFVAIIGALVIALLNAQ